MPHAQKHFKKIPLWLSRPLWLLCALRRTIAKSAYFLRLMFSFCWIGRFCRKLPNAKNVQALFRGQWQNLCELKLSSKDKCFLNALPSCRCISETILFFPIYEVNLCIFIRVGCICTLKAAVQQSFLFTADKSGNMCSAAWTLLVCCGLRFGHHLGGRLML